MTIIDNYNDLQTGDRLSVPHVPDWFGLFSEQTIPRIQYRFRCDPVPFAGRSLRGYGAMLRFPRSIGAHRHAAMLAEMIRSDILRHHNGVSRGYSVPDSNDDIQRPWGKHKSWKLARKTQWK